MQRNGPSHCEFDGKAMETETTWSEIPNGGKAIVEQIIASEERNQRKSKTVRIKVWDSSRKVNYQLFEIEKLYNKVHQIYQFHQNRLANPYDGH